MVLFGSRDSSRDSERNTNSPLIEIIPCGARRESKREHTGMAFVTLGERINELCEFIKERRNIHQNIRALIRGIKLSYIRVLEEKNSQASVGKVTRETQVTPPRDKAGGKTGKRARDGTSEPLGPQQVPKKKKASSPKKAEPARVPAKVGNLRIAATTPTKVEKTNARRPEQWTKVSNKRQRDKKKLRPEIIIISKKENMSYADILRKVKSDPQLKDLGDNVSRIRRTQKGDLMLELNKSADKSADNFRGKVESVLGEEAEVRARKQEIVVECKDLDEVTSREDICAALKQQFNLGDIDQSAIKRMKKAYGGTQTTIIGLPAESAIKLITAGKQEQDEREPQLAAQQDVFSIPDVTEEELWEICRRIGDSKAPGLDGIPNRALKVAVKARPRHHGEDVGEGDIQQAAPVHRACGWSFRAAIWVSASPFYGRCSSKGRGIGSKCDGHGQMLCSGDAGRQKCF
ncbi:unnamed protein product [Hermetia illucens]|uniref:Uncharacterized protein n=1 Tax=Hermetia illucens TaxID=343691 RepID=A0A7R8YQC1_HERIL|nr:unnamed protein product [Hermetia illucens]